MFENSRRWRRKPGTLLATGLVGLALVVLVAGTALRSSRVSDGEDALGGDGVYDATDRRNSPQNKAYAEHYGVSLDEAVRRGLLQEQAAPVKRRLREAAPDRLSAVWLEHEPTFQIVAWYTGPLETLGAAQDAAVGSPIPVTIRGDAPLSEAGFVGVLERIQAALPDDIDAGGLGVEGMTGVVQIDLQPTSPYADEAAELARSLTAQFGVQVRVIVLDEPAGDG